MKQMGRRVQMKKKSVKMWTRGLTQKKIHNEITHKEWIDNNTNNYTERTYYLQG